jgi:Lon protease-like protein
MYRIPLFPLALVLLLDMPLPLYIFEERHTLKV